MGDPSRLPSAYQISLAGFRAGRACRRTGLFEYGFGDRPASPVKYMGQLVCLCRDEHPALMQLAEVGVPIFGLNYKDNEAAAQRFLSRLGNPYRAVGADKTGAVALELGVYGVPETFLLDAQGHVVLRHVGPLDKPFYKTRFCPTFKSSNKAQKRDQ